MSFDYSGMRIGTVLPILGEYGTSCTLTHRETTYNPATMEATTTETTTTANCVIENYTEQQRAGTQILATDKKITGYFSIEPVQGDEISSTLGTFKVIDKATIAPGGVVMLYEVQCRA